MKAELRDRIVIWLREQGIEARPIYNSVAVSRDSMCNSKFRVRGTLPEETVYPAVEAAIRKEFGGEKMDRLCWGGKTDDDLFLDTLRGGE